MSNTTEQPPIKLGKFLSAMRQKLQELNERCMAGLFEVDYLMFIKKQILTPHGVYYDVRLDAIEPKTNLIVLSRVSNRDPNMEMRSSNLKELMILLENMVLLNPKLSECWVKGEGHLVGQVDLQFVPQFGYSTASSIPELEMTKKKMDELVDNLRKLFENTSDIEFVRQTAQKLIIQNGLEHSLNLYIQIIYDKIYIDSEAEKIIASNRISDALTPDQRCAMRLRYTDTFIRLFSKSVECPNIFTYDRDAFVALVDRAVELQNELEKILA